MCLFKMFRGGVIQTFSGVKLGIYMKLQTKPFIYNDKCVQVLSYSKYSLLLLPVFKIEPVSSRWFHLDVH